jgi:hypothetical protein
MQISFTYNYYYNSKPSWIGTLDSSVCILRWNIVGYWEILGWPVEYGLDPRNYTDTLIPNETDWVLYGSPSIVFTEFNLNLGSCPINPVVYDCTLAGNIILTACVLEGNAIITENPLPPCTRPPGLNTFNLITGYSIISPSSTIISTTSAITACDAINYLLGLVTFDNVIINNLSVNASSITLGQILYINNFTNDCSLVPNGFYFTGESIEIRTIYQIDNGVIIDIIVCPGVTTTTTSTSNTTTTTSSTSTTTSTSTSTSTSTTTTTTSLPDCTLEGNGEVIYTPLIECSETTSSGGEGITEYTIPLDSVGGTIIMQLDAFSFPDKLEILHNGIKKATSGMTVPNEGPFDDVYGNTVVPTYSQTMGIDQFIGLDKGAIPNRNSTFISETGITDIIVTMQQLIWWTYTTTDYNNSNVVIVRVTGPSGTVWNIKRSCITTTTTTTVLP